MNKLIITGEGATIEAHGFNTAAPSKDIPVADLLSNWFAFDLQIEIGWVNFIANTDYAHILVPESELTDLRNRAKSAERAAANLRGDLAKLQGEIYPYPTPPAANAPGEIPKSEHMRLQQEVIKLQQELLGVRADLLQAKEESRASQAIWHGVSNECEGLRADVRIAEEAYNALRKRIRELAN